MTAIGQARCGEVRERGVSEVVDPHAPHDPGLLAGRVERKPDLDEPVASGSFDLLAGDPVRLGPTVSMTWRPSASR